MLLLGRSQSSGPIFQVKKSDFQSWISEYFSKGVSGHSFRRSGAQVLFDAGHSISSIQFKGRWKSAAWMRYVNTSSRIVIFCGDKGQVSAGVSPAASVVIFGA